MPGLLLRDTPPQLVGPVNRPPGAHQGIPGEQLVAEPRHVPVLDDAVQPERDLRKLHRHRVQVDAEHVPVGDEVLRLLQLLGVLALGDAPVQLPLPPLKVPLGQLVDGLVQERRRAHRRLAHRQTENALGWHVLVDLLLEGVLHDRLGEALGSVVAGRLLAIPARQPVQEFAPGMH